MTETAAGGVDAVREACDRLEPSRDHAELVEAVSDAVGARAKLVLADAPWYRGGGLVDGGGRRITDDLESWVVEESGGDLIELYRKYGSADYHVTAATGRTLYIVAPTGRGPLDFIQVEVDEAREVIERRLFEGDVIPDTIGDLMQPARLPRPLTPRRYQLRKLTRFRDIAERLTGEHKGDPRFKRFIEEWQASSAGAARRFCDHWVLSMVPYQDADGEHLLEARPIPVAAVMLPDLQRLRTGAADYHPSRAVLALDRQAGYPMAWYFLQIAKHYAPYRCMVDVRDDLRDPPPGVARLPLHDMSLVDNWVEVPYTFH